MPLVTHGHWQLERVTRLIAALGLRPTLRLVFAIILVLLLPALQFFFRDSHYLPQSALELPVLSRWRRVGVEFGLHTKPHSSLSSRDERWQALE
jgi:hypothetical protein